VYNGKELSEQFVTQSAFSQARLKIKPGAFKELCDDSTRFFYDHYEIKKWNGFRLVGIDGSEAMLPKNRETIRDYGEYSTNLMNKTIVLARISKAYDVLNEITIDARLCNKKIGEHYLANQHLAYLGKGDLLIYDRGYPSFDLFRKALTAGCHFCARVPVSNWGASKRLIESGEKELIEEIEPGYSIKKKYKEQGIEYEPIKCRFVAVELLTGEKEVLITSLTDTELYPCEIFQDLYHLRWGIEESYKKDKHRLQLENFSGTSNIAILQDFHANILLGNITSILSHGIEEEIEKKKKLTKHRYKINVTSALSKVRENIPLLFSQLADILFLIERLSAMFLANLLPVRPNRSFPRNKGKRRRYHKTYLTL
jgi:hypothetical protein